MDTKALKVGDKVLISTPHSLGPGQYDVATVAKITPSGQVTTKINEWECKFNSQGRQLGEKWYQKILVPFEQDLLDKQAIRLQMSKYRRRLKETSWDSKDDTVVLKVVELLDAAESGE